MRTFMRANALLLTVLLWSCGLGSLGYQQENGQIVYNTYDEGRGKVTVVVEGADLGSFQALGDGWARDRNRAYYKGSAIAGSQPAGFVVMSETYAKDSGHVYFEGAVVPGAEPSTFVASKDLNLGRDQHDVYIVGSPIGACDPASFRKVSGAWARDDKCAYSGSTKLPGARADSFSVISDTYAKDADHVYTYVKPYVIDGADPATFALARGQAGMYLCDARDKNHWYRFGVITPCEAVKQ